MNIFQRLKERIIEHSKNHGFTCDSCGREVFDYPIHRLCDKCGRKTVAEGICLNCKRSLPKFTKGFSPFVYRGKSAALVNRMKNGNPTLTYFLAEEMADYFLSRYERSAEFSVSEETAFLILPVPMTEGRLRERGYNQAEELAKGILARLREKGYFAELSCEVLQKRKDTAQQKQMGYLERMENVSGAYHVHLRKACRERTVILVDDIMTTGATGSECAERLLHAEAKEVNFLVAASLPEMK